MLLLVIIVGSSLITSVSGVTATDIANVSTSADSLGETTTAVTATDLLKKLGKACMCIICGD